MLRWIWSIERTKGSNNFGEVGMTDRGLLARLQGRSSATQAAESLSRHHGGKAVRMQGWRVEVFYKPDVEPEIEFVLSTELASA